MKSKIEIEIEWIYDDLGNSFTRVKEVKRTVHCDGDFVYEDRLSSDVYLKQGNDPLSMIERGLFHQSYSADNSAPQCNNKIGFFQMLWLKIFG
jgi:hypothetical protein